MAPLGQVSLPHSNASAIGGFTVMKKCTDICSNSKPQAVISDTFISLLTHRP